MIVSLLIFFFLVTNVRLPATVCHECRHEKDVDDKNYAHAREQSRILRLLDPKSYVDENQASGDSTQSSSAPNAESTSVPAVSNSAVGSSNEVSTSDSTTSASSTPVSSASDNSTSNTEVSNSDTTGNNTGSALGSTTAAQARASIPEGPNESVFRRLLNKLKKTLHMSRRGSYDKVTTPDPFENQDDDVSDDIEAADEGLRLHRRHVVHRRRRWDYDADYNWENNGEDYEIPAS